METIFSGRQKPGDHKTGRRDGRQIDVPPGETQPQGSGSLTGMCTHLDDVTSPCMTSPAATQHPHVIFMSKSGSYL